MSVHYYSGGCSTDSGTWVPDSLFGRTLVLSSCFSLPTAFTTGGFGADSREAEVLASFPPAASLHVKLLMP